MADSSYAESVRALNDEFRTTLSGGTVVTTAGVRARGRNFTRRVLTAIKRFDSFEDANDPCREHDLGNFDLEGQSFFFKIDYYDFAMERHSPDASDPDVTMRVMTIMLADKY